MTPPVPSPDMAVKILDRLLARVPADCEIPPEALTVAMMAYLSGVRWEDDAGVMTTIEEALTISAGDRTYNVVTWKGALQLLSFPTDEAWVAQASRAEEDALVGVPLGEWTPWFCMFCGRKWPDGSEPDVCPNCDHPLTRFQTGRRDDA